MNLFFFVLAVLRNKDLPMLTLLVFTARLFLHRPCLVVDFEKIATMSPMKALKSNGYAKIAKDQWKPKFDAV